MEDFIGAAIASIAFAVVPGWIAQRKGHSFWKYWLLGAALSPLLMTPYTIFALKPSMRKCPFCAEMIRAEAAVCRYCGRNIARAGEVARSLGGETSSRAEEQVIIREYRSRKDFERDSRLLVNEGWRIASQTTEKRIPPLYKTGLLGWLFMKEDVHVVKYVRH